MYSLAVFDMAGTTVDEGGEVYRVLREATEREGATYSDETFARYMGTEKRWAIGKLLEAGGIDASEIQIENAWQWFRQELRRSYQAHPPKAMPGIEELFKNLHERGVKVALTTGFSREITDLILEALGWDSRVVDATVAGDEVAEGRPAPLLIQRVMIETGVNDASKVISSGDTEADVVSAKRAGVASVGVLTGSMTADGFASLAPDYVLDSASDLLTVFHGV